MREGILCADVWQSWREREEDEFARVLKGAESPDVALGEGREKCP